MEVANRLILSIGIHILYHLSKMSKKKAEVSYDSGSDDCDFQKDETVTTTKTKSGKKAAAAAASQRMADRKAAVCEIALIIDESLSAADGGIVLKEVLYEKNVPVFETAYPSPMGLIRWYVLFFESLHF